MITTLTNIILIIYRNNSDNVININTIDYYSSNNIKEIIMPIMINII